MKSRSRAQIWMRRCAAAAVLASLLAAAASAADLFAGTWEMNAADSKYAEGELPQSMSIRIESVGQGEHYLSRTVRRNNKVSTAEYTAAYDGSLAMVLGDTGLLAPVSLSRIDDHTLASTYQRAFLVIARSVRVLSSDAGTMTITTTTLGADGQGAVNVSVFHKQPEVLARSLPGQSE